MCHFVIKLGSELSGRCGVLPARTESMDMNRGIDMTLHGKALLVFGIVLLAGCQSASHHDKAQTTYVPDDDMCGASDYQQYIGKPLSSVNNLRFDNPVRAIAPDSVVTMDFNLRRLNFFADAQRNITKVYCG